MNLLAIAVLPALLAQHASHDDATTAWTPVEGWGIHQDHPIGSTHGGVIVDDSGRVLFNTDTPQGTLIFDSAGAQIGTLAGAFPGIHGMQLRTERGTPYLYGAHLAGKQVVKLRLDGTQVWTLGIPMESGKYDGAPQAYNPTAVAVAPDGRIYVADGYGRNWIHMFGPDLAYIKSFGGPGSGPGQFQTCHGLGLDTSTTPPRLVVCDRENRRLQRFTLEGEFVDIPTTGLMRPCSIAFWTAPDGARFAAVAELEGRVTLLDGDWKVIGHLGANDDPSQRAAHGVPPESWRTGVTTAPHGIAFDAAGNLYIEDWSAHGRVHKFTRTSRVSPAGGAAPP